MFWTTGRIKLAGGELSTSLSKAAAYARGTQSVTVWELWQLPTRRERQPLRELRDVLICRERGAHTTGDLCDPPMEWYLIAA
jgi:hypothetical protein